MKSPLTIRRSPSRAFTLVELIVVIGIISLVVGLSLPAISKLTKGNGEKQSVNLISAYLASARATAMNLRRPVAIIFYEDPANPNQTAIALAQFKSSSGTAWLLDGIPGRPTEYLPRGIKVATLDDSTATGRVGTQAAATAAGPARSRVVLFDELGHLRMTAPIGLDIYHTPGGSGTYVPGQVIYDKNQNKSFLCITATKLNPLTGAKNWQQVDWNLNSSTVANPYATGFSSPGVLVYDDLALNDLLNAYGYTPGGAPPANLPKPKGITTWPDYISDWLQKHGDLLIVNSYTGTIIR